jgi:hypothetical protein
MNFEEHRFGMMMSPSRFRVLLLAFVMVLQTMAGGFSVARAMPGGADPFFSAHCSKDSAAADRAGDSGRDGRLHTCDSCLLCAGPPPLAVVGFNLAFATPRAFHNIGFVRYDLSGAPARIARARLARGPPVIAPSASAPSSSLARAAFF